MVGGMIEAQDKSEGSDKEVPDWEWHPRPSQGGLIALAAAALLLAFALAAGVYFQGRPIAIDSFLAALVGLASLLLAIALGVLAFGHRSMRYRLSDQELAISWLWWREVVPLGSIEGMFRGQRLGEKAAVKGIAWPGYYVGTARTEDLTGVRFCGTSSDPSDALLIATAKAAYAVTPDDPAGFRERLIELLEGLPEESVEAAPEPRTEMPSWLRLSFLGDSMVLGSLGAALVVVVLSFGYISARFPGLPELMSLHFNAAGAPDLIGPRGDAFRMPGIGLFLLLANTAAVSAVHGWNRDAGKILAAATVFIQLVMLVAIVRVVH